MSGAHCHCSWMLGFFIATFALLPTIGSRALGNTNAPGGSVIRIEPSSPGYMPGPLTSANSGNNNVNSNTNNGELNASSSCNLVTLSLLDGKDGTLVSYEEKELISVSHHLFQVNEGIVPTIVYQVEVEIPSGHEFSLEYWLNGLTEDRGRLKRRHQRDRREILELFPSSTSADQVVFCSKNSMAGLNKHSSSKLFTFHWYLNGNSLISPTTPSGIPTNLLFRLRFRSIVEATSSVFEQNLDIAVRPDCYLHMKLEEKTKLTLNSIWNSQTDNTGLNCTVLITPKSGFGVEIRLSNLSIYGIRDACKGRFISFSLPQHGSSDNIKDIPSEFPLVSPLERKFCGKFEDYSSDEKILTFAAPDVSDLESAEFSSILLSVSLSGQVKPREGFAMELSSLSPCQKVVLTELDGMLKYSKNYENDDCSIVIHVPYGNTLITQLSLSLGSTDGSPSSGSTGNSNNNYFNESDTDSSENLDNSIPNTNFECLDESDDSTISTNNNSNNKSHTNEDIESQSNAGLQGQPSSVSSFQHLFIRAVDLSSGTEYRWCFDGAKKTHYKRAWRSSGNKVKINFQLKHFDHFELSYQAVKNPAISGDCERGWVNLDYGCVTLVEKLNDWTSAEESCQSSGGHLVTIRNEQIEQKIQTIVTESALFHPSRAYWIGANDRESEGNFQWTSGLPFIYKNWFSGWTSKGSEIVNAQPNDDGWSGQDCVELRQIFSASFMQTETAFSSSSIAAALGKGKVKVLNNPKPNTMTKFYWNDRNCQVKNFYICEKATHQNVDFSCNRTLRFSPPQVSSLTVTSPAYPSSYPDNIVCVTTIETLPGYKLVINFDEFVLEDSPSCKYDSLEVFETTDGVNTEDSNAKNKISRRMCGDWNKRLKLLRFAKASTAAATLLHFKFESDFSHHFSGFKAKVWAEKDMEEQCVDQHMQKFGTHCYLMVSFPAVSWKTAHQICLSLKGNLASVVSLDEWNFLTSNLVSAPDYDKKSIYWLGGSIDQSSQLVWADQMPFNFSAFHPADLQTMSDWRCLSVYWHDSGSKGDFAFRLSECSQTAGYICKKNTQVEMRHAWNRTFSGTGGKLSSPNYPANYNNNLDHANHLIAPRGTQIVVRFSRLDVEAQEDCLYDYVEIIDRKTMNSTRFCGSHEEQGLAKLDYVSSSNEVNILFHTDFSETRGGFEIQWTAVDVKGCMAGKTILTGIGDGFSLHDSTVHTPNFPHFNLPRIDCVYTIVAPAGQRIWLSFQIFELGRSDSKMDCAKQDHVVIDLDGGVNSDGSSPSSGSNPVTTNPNEIIICGNLSSSPFQTSFVSLREKIRIRVFSPEGKTGRGFLGRFKAIPTALRETLPIATQPNTSLSLTSLNYPLSPPYWTNLTVAFQSPPNYVLSFRVKGNTHPNCQKKAKSMLEIRDPYAGNNGSVWIICQPSTTTLLNQFDTNSVEYNVDSDFEPDTETKDGKALGNKMETMSGIDTAILYHSTFNRLDIKQVYAPGYRGNKWNAEIITTLDENFRAKVIAGGDSLLLLNACSPNPCTNGGTCVTDGNKHICRCPPPFTGPFCGMSLCDLNPCLFGECIIEEKSFRCKCQLGYGGERCDRRRKPCDETPCGGHGDCQEVNKTSYQCLCHAWWEGPQCEARMLHIPYKPLSQRMIQEPFWLGLITVTVVLGVIGLIWCLKRHFPEKLEKLLNEDPDRNRGISWVSGRSPSSIRIGSATTLVGGVRDAIPGTSQQAVSPPAARSFLGRFGIRKPSLLSLSSATSAVSVTATSPHSYENRTFSLDDLLRPSRSMMRTPSPHRRRNYSVQVRRDPNEKQQILQQLMSSGGSQSLDGDQKPPTPKPTLAEIIQMSEKRLRLASASSMQSDPPLSADLKVNESETSFTTTLTPTSKAEKKVTFARLLDKLANTEMTSSSSCSDVSCAEDKPAIVATKPPTKKDRKGRFRRSKSYNRNIVGRNSETDQDGVDMSSSDTTPDPIYTPRLPSRICVSPTGVSSNLTLSTNSNTKNSGKMTKIASADSLLALFRRFSGSNSAPPSPQYSENEESSAGPTPLSTPSSPRNSQLSLRPPAFQITTSEPNTIELPVIDPFSQPPGWRSAQASSITLEVPMRDYCLSPIHEVPTPLPTPMHTPAHSPMMRRNPPATLPTIKLQSSEDDDAFRKDSPPAMRLQIPIISISVEDADEDDEEEEDEKNDCRKPLLGESEVIPDVLIHVPPDAVLEGKPENEFFFTSMPVRPIRTKGKPPPLVFANEILASANTKSNSSTDDSLDGNPKSDIVVPVLNVEFATPVDELTPRFPCLPYPLFQDKNSSNDITPHSLFPPCAKPWDNPLAPPLITINQSSEAESDSDTPVRKLLRRPNLTFLSPFASTSDRVPSESNLSTSGYSSMASPCPSRCPSVSPLCSCETDDYHNGSHGHIQGHQHLVRRSSLTPATSRKASLTPRRCSLNATSPLVSMSSNLICDNLMIFSEKTETENNDNDTPVETDSAVEVETDVDYMATMSEVENPPLTPIEKSNIAQISEEMKCLHNLLQVPRKSMPKSRSLDMNEGVNSKSQSGSSTNSSGINNSSFSDRERRNQLKGESLDSKLNSFDPSSNPNGVTISLILSDSNTSLNLNSTNGQIIDIPEDKDRTSRLSPVSSRSDSPISDLSATGCGFQGGLTSPITDSDGMYDCPSSEVPTTNNENKLSLNFLSHQQQIRRAGRRRDRRMFKNIKVAIGTTETQTENSNANTSHNSNPSQGDLDKRTSSGIILDLPLTLAREHLLPGGPGGKRTSPKRRVRAQPNLDATSSSSESLNSPRSRSSCVSSPQLDRQQESYKASLLESSSSIRSPSKTMPVSHGVSQDCADDSSKNTSCPFKTDLEEAGGDKDIPENPGSSKASGLAMEATNSPGHRKISRLRTISHQIRFLRRLELSLIRKKESLTVATGEGERRESLLSRSDSSDSSRGDTSDNMSQDDSSLADNEKPLIALPGGGGVGARRKRKGKVLPLPLSLNILETADLLTSHKKRIRRYK